MRKMTAEEFGLLVEQELLPDEAMAVFVLGAQALKAQKEQETLREAMEADIKDAEEYVLTRNLGVYL